MNVYEPPKAVPEVKRVPAPEFAQPLAAAAAGMLPIVIFFRERLTGVFVNLFGTREAAAVAMTALTTLAVLVGVVGGIVALAVSWGKESRGVRVPAAIGILFGLGMIGIVLLALVGG